MMKRAFAEVWWKEEEEEEEQSRGLNIPLWVGPEADDVS